MNSSVAALIARGQSSEAGGTPHREGSVSRAPDSVPPARLAGIWLNLHLLSGSFSLSHIPNAMDKERPRQIASQHRDQRYQNQEILAAHDFCHTNHSTHHQPNPASPAFRDATFTCHIPVTDATESPGASTSPKSAQRSGERFAAPNTQTRWTSDSLVRRVSSVGQGCLRRGETGKKR